MSETPSTPPTNAAAVAGMTRAHADLASIVLSDQPLGAVLTRVTRIAQALIPGVDEVSVTLVDQGRPRTVAFSGERAPKLDERQYEAGFGPCLDAALSGQIVEVLDTADDPTYKDFGRQAASTGIRSSFSVGLPNLVEGQTAGLNLYAADGPLDDVSRELAIDFTSYVAVAVANASVHAGALAEAGHMRAAMASRAVIEQAKGIIMATRHCNAEAAFDVLRTASSLSNRKLRDIAQEIVDGIVRS